MSQSSTRKSDELDGLMTSYYSYIGSTYVDNIIEEIESNKDAINKIILSEDINSWFKRYSKELRRKDYRNRFIVKSKRLAVSAAIFLVFVLISLSILTVSVEAFRTKFFNLFIETNETHTNVKVDERDESEIEGELWNDSYWPSYLPDGFEMNSKKIFNKTKFILYTNGDRLVTFAQGPNGTEFQLDTEKAQISEVIINNNKGILAEKGTINILFWSNDQASFYITSSVQSEELIKIANEIEKNKFP